jgi:hypothetical protein
MELVERNSLSLRVENHVFSTSRHRNITSSRLLDISSSRHLVIAISHHHIITPSRHRNITSSRLLVIATSQHRNIATSRREEGKDSQCSSFVFSTPSAKLMSSRHHVFPTSPSENFLFPPSSITKLLFMVPDLITHKKFFEG